MPVIRNRLSNSKAGGPRQFAELRDSFGIVLEDSDVKSDVESRLRRLGFTIDSMNNAPVLFALPKNKFTQVMERFKEQVDDNPRVRKAIEEVEKKTGEVNDLLEADVATRRVTTQLRRFIQSLDGVNSVDFIETDADYGPENLRVSPSQMPTVPEEDVHTTPANLGELNKKLGIKEAWNTTRGENAVVCIFDTGFAEGLIDKKRIIHTFHGDMVDSVYAAAEGHGTMTAGAATANEKEGVPYNGAAPEADVILVRVTDDKGQIRGDIITKAWDWLGDLSVDKPIVANHSYGTPICSGRPKARFCNGATAEVITRVSSTTDVTSVYAAGNEAMTCGHRPSGLTNAVTGINSLDDVITVGALRFDLLGAQRYSSHGRGDCAPISDPKPNVSCALPMKTYYGTEEGVEIKNMETGIGGSSGGTSHAAPTTAGMIALLQSAAVESNGEALSTEEVKQILHDNSEPPHATTVNKFGFILSKKGYDARFGYGQPDIVKAINEVV